MLADYLNINSIVLHLANVRFGDYYAGMFHVLSGIEYLIPLIAIALFRPVVITNPSPQNDNIICNCNVYWSYCRLWPF